MGGHQYPPHNISFRDVIFPPKYPFPWNWHIKYIVPPQKITFFCLLLSDIIYRVFASFLETISVAFRRSDHGEWPRNRVRKKIPLNISPWSHYFFCECFWLKIFFCGTPLVFFYVERFFASTGCSKKKSPIFVRTKKNKIDNPAW